MDRKTKLAIGVVALAAVPGVAFAVKALDHPPSTRAEVAAEVRERFTEQDEDKDGRLIVRRRPAPPAAEDPAALFALPMVSLAQDGAEEAAAEEESSIYSWNAAIATDYMFRGASQTDGEAALQLGADLNFDNGFYVGVWGSNVDFGAGSPDVEIDTYIGWNHDLTERLNLDLMVNRYNYIGEADDFGDSDYNEFIGALTLDEAYTFTLGYTNDVYALGETGMYFGLGGSWELPYSIGLDVAAGRSTFDEATGYEDYSDFSISFNKDFGPVNAAIGYYGTDADGDVNFGDAADNRFMLTLSIGG